MTSKTPWRPTPPPLPVWFPRGAALLRDPALNKGTAFNDHERDLLGLRGLLPPHVCCQDEEVQRVLENFRRLDSDLSRYILLEALHDRDEALFFRVIIENPDEMMPIIYTPTVGLACQQFGHIYRRPRGLYVSPGDRGHIGGLLRNWPYLEARMIVVTDGERILGLGDLGANGMGIPIGKLALYTACAGLHPRHCMPVMLDCGTNNEALLADPLYIGVRQHRLADAAMDEYVEEFVQATQHSFPGIVIQFEDFANHNAFRLLRNYRDRICCFNDDIQGTAAVTVAGIYSALKITGSRMAEQKILFLGAGEAAVGISDLMVMAMVADGLDEKSARRRCWMVDSKGLVVAGRKQLAEHKRPYAHDHAGIEDFASAVSALRPTAIIGVGAAPQAFTRQIVEEMARINERPIIFSLSNPTSKSECTAEQAYTWSGGRALYASGSPFDPVTLDGRRFVPRQGNNSYIFPGVGLGVVTVWARHVTDEMFMVAARTLADSVTAEDLAQGSLYPSLSRVREVSGRIAAAVGDVAVSQGLAGIEPPDDMYQLMLEQMYDGHYVNYVH